MCDDAVCRAMPPRKPPFRYLFFFLPRQGHVAFTVDLTWIPSMSAAVLPTRLDAHSCTAALTDNRRLSKVQQQWTTATPPDVSRRARRRQRSGVRAATKGGGTNFCFTGNDSRTPRGVGGAWLASTSLVDRTTTSGHTEHSSCRTVRVLERRGKCAIGAIPETKTVLPEATTLSVAGCSDEGERCSAHRTRTR